MNNMKKVQKTNLEQSEIHYDVSLPKKNYTGATNFVPPKLYSDLSTANMRKLRYPYLPTEQPLQARALPVTFLACTSCADLVCAALVHLEKHGERVEDDT